MAKVLDMPKLSPTMEEGVLQTWHKKEGDSVEVDDLLAEVETDKATMEFRAFDKGTLLKILVPAGTNVKLGQAVAVLGNPGEDVSGLVKDSGGGAGAPAEKPKDDEQTEAKKGEPKDDAKEEKPAAKDEAKPAEKQPVEAAPETSRSIPAVKPKKAPAPKTGSLLTRTETAGEPDDDEIGAANGRVLASPYVRKVARERGIDLSGAQGSGDHGRIVPSDLDSLRRAPATTPAPAHAPAAAQSGQAQGGQAQGGQAQGGMVRAADALAARGLAAPEARPLSPMRKTIARRLSESKRTVPHFYLTIDVDAGPLSAFRESINAELSGSGGAHAAQKNPDEKPLKVSINDLLIKAVATALVAVPECNATFTEEALLIHQRVDVSVAVAIPDGLVTPVVRNADQKGVAAIAREVRDLAARARAKKLKPEEMTDGTFSISNLGMFGIDEFSAVINPPEGAILAVGQVRDEPVVKDGEVKPGKKLAMTLSCDHRVIDGAVGAAFLAELRALLSHPIRILTG